MQQTRRKGSRLILRGQENRLSPTYVETDANVSNAMRIGKRGAKACLLKVTVGSTKEKASILKGCTKLRFKNNPIHVQKIDITPDLTPKQHVESKALRAKLQELNKSEKLYSIKNGEIVRRDPTP